MELKNRFAEMGHFYEAVLPPEDIRNCIGLILYKPDAIATTLENVIGDYVRSEMERRTGYRVEFFGSLFRKYKPEVVDALYPEIDNETYLKYIRNHLGSGLSGVVLVAAKNAPEELNKIKGSVKTGKGIRGMFCQYQPISQKTLSNWQAGKLSPEETREIGIQLFAANLVHIPDNRDATIIAMRSLYPVDEIDDMKQSIPIFSKWLNEE